MPENIRYNESLLFNYETTSRTDYRDGKIRPLVRQTYRIKQKCPRPEPVPLKDLHALTPWKDPHIPFDLYHRPTGVLRTDPRIIQEKYVKPPDVDRVHVQKTRPKVVMTPALDLDRVEEPYRQMFVDHVYSSETTKALKDAVARAGINNVRAPLSEVYAKGNPISLEPFIEPFVSPEWRMDSVSWDNRQLRTYTEPTKTFWLSRPKPDCSICKSTAIRDAMKRRRR